MDTNDQVQDETLNGESNSSEEQSTEATKEPITPERAYELAKGLQKGYTLTRQEISEIRNNLDEIQSAIQELRSRSSEETFGVEEEKPLTKKDLLEILDERERKKAEETGYYEKLVDSQIADLRVQGVITSDADEEDLLQFATEHKMTDLSQAAAIWKEVKEARKLKETLKSKVKGEAGSKVGTSEKTNVGEEGVSYKEISRKDWDEI